jgi:hypothetical protein
MIYGCQSCAQNIQVRLAEGATMYELLGALAFMALLVSQVLAVLFVRHDLTDEDNPTVHHHRKLTPPATS